MRAGIFADRKIVLSILPLSLLIAALGFSVALATSTERGASRQNGKRAGNRDIGQELKFTHPFLQEFSGTNALEADTLFYPRGGDVPNDPAGFDLGDASVTGGTITRYVTAAGGYLPYRFLTKSVLDLRNVASNGTVYEPPLLLPFGKLVTSVPVVTGAARFDVFLTDFISTQRSGRFRLNLVDGTREGFRFAISQLPFAQQGRSYFTNVPLIAGTPPFKFEVAANSIFLGAMAQARLEDTGLTLNPGDGTLFGRPIGGADITFVVRATDAAGLTAKSRDGLRDSQSFKISVEKDAPVTTEVAATQCQLRGQVPNPLASLNKDTFTYTAYLDPKGETAASLAGTHFIFRLNGGTFFEGSSRFDAKGKIKLGLDADGKPVAGGTKGAGAMDVSFSAGTGRLSVKLRGVSLGAAVGAGNAIFRDGTSQPLIIGVEVGNFRTCEVLMSETRVRGGRFTMQYTLGRRGFSRGGAFQILELEGADIIPQDDEIGAKWLVRVLGVPPQDAVSADGGNVPFGKPKAAGVVGATTSVDVSIGDYDQTVTVALKSVRLEFKSDFKTAGIYQVLLDPKKFVHRVQTNRIGLSDSNIPQAISTKQPTLFPFGLKFTGMKGETGRVMAPDRDRWVLR